ncbi:MAG: nucleotide exchange factor GrpE [Desulfobacterales bacterium]|nr:nucleotide exchange factor GrpE [Desulfobacterales bacterium]
MTKENQTEISSETETSAAEAAPTESGKAPPDAAGHAPGEDVADQAAEAPAQVEAIVEPDDLQTQLTKAQSEAQENYERFLRAAAELDNFRKRKEREVNDLRKYANQNLLKELLGVVDNLERAILANRDEGSSTGLVEGVDMTLKELLKIFEKSGVTPIAAVDQPFDPNLHEAVMQEECADVPENTVVRELQKGYQIHDRLLRPAMVVVSR